MSGGHRLGAAGGGGEGLGCCGGGAIRVLGALNFFFFKKNFLILLKCFKQFF